jgi:predicted RecA/RadA family phage recombinase
MSVRDQNLENVGAVFATFEIHQTEGVDDLKDEDLGKAVAISDDYEVSFGTSGGVLLGRLVGLTLTDADQGKRVATVQVGGIATLPATTTVPGLGDRVVVDGDGSVKKAPALAGNDPAGGNVARGTVIAVHGTTEVTLILN